MITKNESYQSYKDSRVSWIGKIPSDWEISKLKFQTHINKYTLAENTDPFYEIQYIDIGNVNSNGHIGELQKYYFEQAPSRARRIVKSGDTLISTVRTYLKAITSVKEAPGNLICSTGFAVLTPKKDIDSLYLSYLVRSEVYIDEIVSRSTGVSYPAINASEIGDLECILPDLETQKKIGKFLEGRSNEIESLINGKQKLIKLLEEKRQSLITEAVTKGLNPDVKMKNSGVKWVDEIPEHWDVKKVKHIAAKENYSLVDGPFGSDLKNEEYRDEGVPIIQLNNIRNGEHLFNNIKYVTEEKAQQLYKHTAVPGELVIAKMAHPVGRSAIVDSMFQKYIIVADCIKLTLDKNFYNKFINYAMNTPYFISQAELVAGGITRLRINLGELKQLKLFIPPYQEQLRICKYLDEKVSEINNSILLVQKQIEKLKEYQQSLIYEAVTGKIDVRDFEVVS